MTQPKAWCLGVGIGACLIWAAGAAGCRAGRERPRSNLILVVVDTLRLDAVGAYDPASRGDSPAIDSLARSGVSARGLAPSSWTRPSVATLLTGLSPVRHQTLSKGDRVPAGARLLSERLKAAGYSTLGVTTNGHVSSAWGFDRGFDKLLATWREGLEAHPTAQRVNDLLFAELGSIRPPFFLYVHYLDPHQPYEPQARFLKPEETVRLAGRKSLREGAELLGSGGNSPEILEAARVLYRGEVRQVDAGIGDLIQELARRRWIDNTLIVVTADHGEEFEEHGRVGHGKSLYEEVVRVPLIFHGPSVSRGAPLGDFPLESVVPTVLELLGISPSAEAGFDGPSYAEAVRRGDGAPRLGPRLLYLEGNPDGGIALLDHGWKLVLHLGPYGKKLFDLTDDPAESIDRTLEHPDQFGRLAGLLAAEHNRLSRLALRREPVAADEELVAQLAALGYGNARPNEFVPRAFPRRLQAADPRPGGLRGWEYPERFRSCSSFREDPSRQLLMGWYGTSPGEAGRWSQPEATLGIAKPQQSGSRLRLELEGMSFRPERCTLSVQWEDSTLVERVIAPGPFALSIEIDARSDPERWLLVRLKVTPPFRPQEHGLDDARVLGLHFIRYCLKREPEP